MKLYDWQNAPNPRRVRMFIAEKGLQIPREDVSAGAGLADGYLAQSATRTVPCLELDDGTRITEAPAICRYLDSLAPEPRLLGANPLEAALIEMWERRCELEGIHAAAEALRNRAPAFQDRALPGYPVAMPQIPELVARGQRRVAVFHKRLDEELSTRPFIVGDRFSFADITAYCAVEFAAFVRMPIPDDCRNLRRWHDTVAARPSAKV